MRIPRLAEMLALGSIAAMCSTAFADSSPGVSSEPALTGAQAAATAEAIAVYWTPERMAEARPMPVPTMVVDEFSLANPSGAQAIAGDRGFAPGCRPGATDCDTRPRSLPTLGEFDAKSESESDFENVPFGNLVDPRHGTKPTTNPRTGPYGPFQRWREAEPITTYPKSTMGKLFFSLPAGNYVCSASVVGRSTVITAGHCNSDGAGTFATNRLFCPSYNNAGPHPARGCWAVTTSTVSSRWHTLGDPDFDYSCLVTNTTGTVVANKIGNATGWLGRGWNFPAAQAERTFGYPQASPFNGYTLQTTASTEWYTHDFVAGLQVSKIIGSDLTGGSSGGPWILGWKGGGGLAETADTDAVLTTDPGEVWVNGLNSHKRCLVNCNTPPTTTSGVFWQEMTSPPFMNTTAVGESEDVLATCLAHPNNS